MSADVVLALHSHLPWVLHHGRWPHGSDWLCEAALETYLPLLEVLRELDAEGTPAPLTLGITPILANQLAHPDFRSEMRAFFAQRLAACDEAPTSLETTGDTELLPLVGYWRRRLEVLRDLFESIEGDIPAAFAALESHGRLELISSAATHGFLPLLARDESIRLQLALGAQEHRRLFGQAPVGCWLPECAYRPREAWHPWPTAPRAAVRRGLDEHLADAGYQFTFVDAHLVTGAQPLAMASHGDGGLTLDEATRLATGERTPYAAVRISHPGSGRLVAAFARDPRASAQVWSRAEGYPGDGAYLEFHKLRWPGGLRLWRVTGTGVDLGAKLPYDPAVAHARAQEHAEHFARLLRQMAATQTTRGAVIAAPFDTELFGHWWYEGPEFLRDVFRALRRQREATPVTGSAHLAAFRPRAALRLPSGSWGARGDFSFWLSLSTAWTWERLWRLEETFWDVAPGALATPGARVVLAQATRELLLAQSSDWQFIMSTGAVADYAERRFREHAENAERLVDALGHGSLEEGQRRAEELHAVNDCFPEPLPAVAAALAGTRALRLM